MLFPSSDLRGEVRKEHSSPAQKSRLRREHLPFSCKKTQSGNVSRAALLWAAIAMLSILRFMVFSFPCHAERLGTGRIHMAVSGRNYPHHTMQANIFYHIFFFFVIGILNEIYKK